MPTTFPMQQTLPWILALVAVAALALALVWLILRPRKTVPSRPLPTEWALSARPVFSADERRIYRQLREALPHHIVLAKLPMVRFCQPNDPQHVRYWYDLLGGIHVTFAVCSANGRVLAAVDLASEQSTLSRTAQIKQAVLGACRVRYLRCPIDHLPSIPELQLLVPQSAAASRGPQPAPAVNQARATLATAVASRRRERTTLWQDSGFFHDSFFASENRREAVNSEPGALSPATSAEGPATQPPDLMDLLTPSPLRVVPRQVRH